MSIEQSNKPLFEKLTGLSKRLDTVGIVGGLAVGLVNPVLGGVIAGGSVFTYEMGNRAESFMRERRSRIIGGSAINHA